MEKPKSLGFTTNRREIRVPKCPLIMGVLNVTPDSFYDGGGYFSMESAVEHGLRLVAGGAHILDVGGESSRPGSEPVSAAEELSRVIPVIRGIRQRSPVPISIDTWKPETAEAAVKAGAEIVNDITGLREPGMVHLVKALDVAVVAMHMRGYPRNMQQIQPSPDILGELDTFFADILKLPLKTSKIILDPGIGFGKTAEDNLKIIKNLNRFLGFERPVLVGASRKSFLGKITGLPADKRLPGSLAAAVLATVNGAAIIRCHDVEDTIQAVRVARAILDETTANL